MFIYKVSFCPLALESDSYFYIPDILLGRGHRGTYAQVIASRKEHLGQVVKEQIAVINAEYNLFFKKNSLIRYDSKDA